MAIETLDLTQIKALLQHTITADTISKVLSTIKNPMVKAPLYILCQMLSPRHFVIINNLSRVTLEILERDDLRPAIEEVIAIYAKNIIAE